jgi:hypothetical protein
MSRERRRITRSANFSNLLERHKMRGGQSHQAARNIATAVLHCAKALTRDAPAARQTTRRALQTLVEPYRVNAYQIT